MVSCIGSPTYQLAITSPCKEELVLLQRTAVETVKELMLMEDNGEL